MNRTEKMINKAFSGPVPDVFESAAAECCGQYAPETAARPKSRIRGALKTAAAAAALAAVLTVTATAINFTGLMSGDEAVVCVMNYAVRNADTEEESSDLSAAILGGLSYDAASTEKTVEFGNFGLRPVYNVSFKAAGNIYYADVDAKTGVVLSCEKEPDPDWKEHLKETADTSAVKFGSGYIRLKEGTDRDSKAETGDIDFEQAFMITEEYFGLDAAGTDSYPMCTERFTSFLGTQDKYSGDTMHHLIYITHGGYVYEARIDSVSGEVLEAYASEDPDFEGERHLHTASDEYIGIYHAYLMAKEAAAAEFGDGADFNVYSVGVVKADDLCPRDRYEETVYGESVSKFLKLIIDARTGEVIESSVGEAGTLHTPESETAIAIPSAEAPDGMISEAEAQMTAFEESGVTMNDLAGFEIELEDGVYKMTVTTLDGESFECRVDAVTGEFMG